MSAQKPLELILARNLLSSISTPAFLVGPEGMMLFYNEAAGALLGRRFEESGTMTAAEWTSQYGPFGENGEPLPYDEIPLTHAIRAGRPAHFEFTIRSAVGDKRVVAASGIPIVGTGGSSGAIVIFWPVTEEAGTT
jgi:PAS domain-containing protein